MIFNMIYYLPLSKCTQLFVIYKSWYLGPFKTIQSGLMLIPIKLLPVISSHQHFFDQYSIISIAHCKSIKATNRKVFFGIFVIKLIQNSFNVFWLSWGFFFLFDLSVFNKLFVYWFFPFFSLQILIFILVHFLIAIRYQICWWFVNRFLIRINFNYLEIHLPFLILRSNRINFTPNCLFW